MAARNLHVKKQLDNVQHEITQQVSLAKSLKYYSDQLSKRGTDGELVEWVSSLHDRVTKLVNTEEIDKWNDVLQSTSVKPKDASADKNGGEHIDASGTEIGNHILALEFYLCVSVYQLNNSSSIAESEAKESFGLSVT